MKIIKKYNALHELEVEPETALESLLDVGEIVELDYKDYKIIEKVDNHFILAE